MRSYKTLVTVIGDSTIDNKVWVYPGIIGNFLRTRLGMKRDDSDTRIKKSHSAFFKPELSVIEHLQDSLSDYHILDYTNDGFTTTDCLNGARRDKVFGQGTFDLFPHQKFKPLEEAAEDIKKSQAIILSIGGNNVREFLQDAYSNDDNFIKQEFPNVLEKIKEEYVEILSRLRELNSEAKIILVTQYYPSFRQNSYKIYPFMKKLGRVLNLGQDPTEPADVIHALMRQTYSAILKAIEHDNNIVIADVTSSLNPFDTKNHTHQIEPSGIGGKKIAQMLNYVLEDNKNVLLEDDKTNIAYQFSREFFESRQLGVLAPENQGLLGVHHGYDASTRVRKIALKDWMPKHPHELIDASCHQLLGEIYAKKKQCNAFKHHSLHRVCDQIYKEGKSLLERLHDKKDLQELATSLKLTIAVIENPTSQTIKKLKNNAKEHAVGKPNYWKKFTGALMMLAGIAILGMSIAGIPFTAGVSLTGMVVGGSVLTAGGAALFYQGRKKSFAKSLSTLVKVAERDEQSAANEQPRKRSKSF